jgi:predicted esterase
MPRGQGTRAPRRASSLAVLAALLVSSSSFLASGAAAQAGWRELDLGGGHRATRFLPSGVRTCDPLPTLVFLHGAGGTPEAYAPHLEPHAEAMGLVLLLPQSSGASGWSGSDAAILNDALDAIALELLVDDTRTYLGGHSAGGAFSYLLTYDSVGIAAVFSMSAPFYMVSALGEPSYPAPIRMYYGDTDPNYTGGSASSLAAQWDRLGVPHETDVQAGYAHSSWPATSIESGLAFLLAHRHPGTPPTSRCGDPDAGAGVSDAQVSLDAALLELDAGASPADASAASTDARASTEDAGRVSRPIASGCACRAGTTQRSGAPWAWLVTALALASCPRRTRTKLRKMY